MGLLETSEPGLTNHDTQTYKYEGKNRPSSQETPKVHPTPSPIPAPVSFLSQLYRPMRIFPQELLDMVIDELVVLHECEGGYFAPYSLVSRAWLERTQKYHFRIIRLDGMKALGKWSRNIAPDPAGVSRHTRELVLTYVDTLEGFEAHICAFTRLKYVEISGCNPFLTPSAAECFASTSSSLARLGIWDLQITSSTITNLLAQFPHLKFFAARYTKVTDDSGGLKLVPRIPFFEGNNSLALSTYPQQQGSPPDWIPPYSQFGRLEIDTSYFLHKRTLVNQWLSSSCATLKFLIINAVPDGTLTP